MNQHPDLPDTVRIQWRVDNSVELYTLYCPICDEPRKARRTGEWLLCHHCQAKLGKRLPEDYTRLIIERGMLQ